MTLPVWKPSVSAGELSPQIYGRTDLAKYGSGLSTCRNFFASYRGGVTSRAGTRFVGQCKQGNKNTALSVSPPRIIPFAFSVTQGIILEFGERYIRFAVAGAYITEAPTTITGISQASPGLVTDPGHPYSNGDEVFISGVGGMLQINNRSFEVANVTTDTYTLVSTLTGFQINTDDYFAYTSGGTAQRIYTLASPYAAYDLPLLKFAQSADVMTLTHPSYPPYDLARITSTDWILTRTTFGSGIPAPSSIAITETDSGISTKSFYYQFVSTAVNSTTGEESVASPVGTVLAVDIATEAATIVIDSAGVTGASSYNFYAAPVAYKNPPTAGALFGYIGTSFGPSFTDTNVVPDYAVTPPLHKNPFATSSLLAVKMTAQGGGYSATGTTAVVSSPIGQNPVLLPVVINGGVAWTIVQNGGAGLTGGETVYFNDALAGGTAATGNINFGVNPSNSDTITLNGDVWTFVTTVTGANQSQIGPTLAASLIAMAGALGASGDAAVTVANYAASADTLYITYKTTGTAGNAYTLAASAATTSGTTLTGGASSGGGGTGASATLDVGPATGTWPSCVAYFQQRRIYANTNNQPDTYFASQPGAYTNMDSSVPVTDSDAIIGSPWSQQVNGIQWMLNMPGGLVIFTGLGAWQLSGSGSGLATSAAITPSNQVANPQAYNGCSPLVPPIAINYDILYVQEKGSIVRDLSYNFFVNIYTGTDMTVLSNHLFDGYTIQQWGWAEEPNKLLWAVRNDGVLLCLTYLKEQDVYAWSRHDTNGVFMSVATVSEPPVNAPYFVVRRLIQNTGQPAPPPTPEPPEDYFWDDDGVLALAINTSYPTSAFGLSPGDVYSDGLAIAIVPGFVPVASAPLYFGRITPAQLLTMGAVGLPTTQPASGSLQLWNNNNLVCVA